MLKETYEVATYGKEVGSGFKICVAGDTSLPWDDILAKLETLKAVSEEYKPSDYPRLAEIVLGKQQLNLQVRPQTSIFSLIIHVYG